MIQFETLQCTDDRGGQIFWGNVYATNGLEGLNMALHLKINRLCEHFLYWFSFFVELRFEAPI